MTIRLFNRLLRIDRARAAPLAYSVGLLVVSLAIPYPLAAADGVVCDRFVLRSSVKNNILSFSIDTDLPDETEVNISVSREYRQIGGDSSDSAYSRDYFKEASHIGAWRQPRTVSLNSDAWRANLRTFQRQMANVGIQFSVGRISDEVEIHAVVHMNQPDPRFGGKGNPALKGRAVSHSGSRRYVVATKRFVLPLD